MIKIFSLIIFTFVIIFTSFENSHSSVIKNNQCPQPKIKTENYPDNTKKNTTPKTTKSTSNNRKKSVEVNKEKKNKTSTPKKIDSFISSKSYLVYDESRKKSYISKDIHLQLPIASITKLMSAMVLLDSGLSMDEKIEISHDDVDTIRNSSSRLDVGAILTRKELLQMALMSSENRATFALSRVYPGGRDAFVKAMNDKAKDLGMKNTHFVEPTGLSEQNVSTAEDLLKMVHEANKYLLIKQYSTIPQKEFNINGKILTYRNSNYLVRIGEWDINLSKTGFIKESGKCLVMQAMIGKNPVIFIILGSESGETRIHDASKLRDIYIAKNGGKV